jgi:hypothetical protein
MDLAKVLQILEKNELKVNLVLEGRKIFEIRAKGKEIDLDILNIEDFKNLIKEIR